MDLLAKGGVLGGAAPGSMCVGGSVSEKASKSEGATAFALIGDRYHHSDHYARPWTGALLRHPLLPVPLAKPNSP